MSELPILNIEPLNLRLSPMLQGNGQTLFALNVKRDSMGAFKKRSGYTTFLGTPDNSTVNTLFSWQQNNGNTYLYRSSGTTLYHSISGTGAWTTSGNGTITNGTQVFHGVTADTLLVSQKGGTTRHSTNGTSFTDTSGAPTEGLGFAEFEGRMWAIGTASSNFYSTTGTPTDWTTDSSSIDIPGPGRLNTLNNVSNSLVHGKTSGIIKRYDGYQLRDLSTNLAYTSPYSIGAIEGYNIGLTRLGYVGYGGDKPEILSDDIQRQIYNDLGSGIPGTTFDNAPGIVYKYDYFCEVGTITDDLTHRTIPDSIHKYDFKAGEWVNWKFANRPTAFGTFEDINGNEQLIFGDSTGQCYQLNGTAVSDNGNPIEVQVMGFYHGGNLNEKEWKTALAYFNPGCQAKLQVALSDTFTLEKLSWMDVGDASDGVKEFSFPSGSRSRFCFWKVYENSTASPFQFYGIQFVFDTLPTK